MIIEHIEITKVFGSPTLKIEGVGVWYFQLDAVLFCGGMYLPWYGNGVVQ